MENEFRNVYIAVALVLSVLLVRRYITRRGVLLPPGPKGLPVIGNVLQVPQDFAWLQFAKWGEEFGDIVHVAILSQPFIILNSVKACISLLDQKSAFTSDRATLPMASMSGWDAALPFIHYGKRWKEYRRILHKSIGTKLAMERDGLLHLEEEGARRFLTRLVDRQGDGDISKILQQTYGAVLLKITFGYEVQDPDGDRFMHLQQQLVDQVTELTTPGAFLVDLFPSLKFVPSWLPGAGFKSKAKLYKKILYGVIDEPHAFVKQQLASNEALPSITSTHLKANPDSEQEYCLKWAAGAVYGAGVDTTITAIRTFFLLMCLYPGVQQKAQAEIDALLGDGYERLPTLADRDSLPYVDAVLKECLRWNPVAPLGMPHCISEDIIHEGYLLPKGAWVFANIWKLAHDPNTYSNPMHFDPDRFLQPEPEQDPRSFVYGFGRRICPGLVLADTSIFTFCASALTVFNISHGDLAGISGEKPSLAELRESVQFDSSIVCAPKPFDCKIRPRSSKALALIREGNHQR